jgi:hypothetical protein
VRKKKEFIARRTQRRREVGAKRTAEGPPQGRSQKPGVGVLQRRRERETRGENHCVAGAGQGAAWRYVGSEAAEADGDRVGAGGGHRSGGGNQSGGLAGDSDGGSGI